MTKKEHSPLECITITVFKGQSVQQVNVRMNNMLHWKHIFNITWYHMNDSLQKRQIKSTCMKMSFSQWYASADHLSHLTLFLCAVFYYCRRSETWNCSVHIYHFMQIRVGEKYRNLWVCRHSCTQLKVEVKSRLYIWVKVKKCLTEIRRKSSVSTLTCSSRGMNTPCTAH